MPESDLDVQMIAEDIDYMAKDRTLLPKVLEALKNRNFVVGENYDHDENPAYNQFYLEVPVTIRISVNQLGLEYLNSLPNPNPE